jgi:hypothetical protein
MAIWLVLVLSETVLSETVLVIVLAAVRREVILWVMNY